MYVFNSSGGQLKCMYLTVLGGGQLFNSSGGATKEYVPVRSREIAGIQRSVQLAPSAYLASAAGCCSKLIRQILPPQLTTSSDPLVEEALSLWQATDDNPPPSHPSSHRQRVWDSAVVEASFNALVVSAPDTEYRACLLAVSCPESGAWLHAMPISSVVLRMDDDVVRVAVSLRLGIPMCHPHSCVLLLWC